MVLWLVFAFVTLILVLELLEFVLEVVAGPTSTLLALVVLSLVAYALVVLSLVADSGGSGHSPFAPGRRTAVHATEPRRTRG